MKKEDLSVWMVPFIIQARACLCQRFNSKRDFNLVKLHLPGNGVFVCLNPQLRFIYFVHQTYEMCGVCFCRSDEWAKCIHSICDYVYSSHVLRKPMRSWRCFFFLSFFLFSSAFSHPFLPVLSYSLFLHVLSSLLPAFCHPWHEVSNGRRAVY